MDFSQAVRQTHGLRSAFKPGLHALRASDRSLITADNPRGLLGSVDIDSTLAPLLPNEPRWDYVVAQAQNAGTSERLHWIEVHPASSTGNIAEVLSKLAWLKAWKAGTPLCACRNQDFVWVASGRTAFHAGSREMKALAKKGLAFRGGSYRIP